jgi:tight adherence protein C
MTTSVLLLVMVAASGLFAAIAVYDMRRETRRAAARMRSIGSSANAQRRALRVNVQRRAETGTLAGFIKASVERLHLLSSKEAASGRILLVNAGIRNESALGTFLFLRVSMPMAFGAAVLIDGYLIPLVRIPPNFVGLAAAVATVVGFYAPIVMLKNRISKRKASLRKSLPDGIDLLVICVESGATINEAFARVGRELARGHPALAEEFTITAAELAFLPVRRTALENLMERTGLPAVRGIVTTMAQSERFGTPIAQALRVLSVEFREARMMAAETRASKLPVLLTVPMMIFILPVLFIVLLGPAALTILDAMAAQ